MDPQPRAPEAFSEILGRLFAERGWGRRNDQLRLEQTWFTACGPEFQNDTRVRVLRGGTLEIEVRGAVRLQELSQFHKRPLLKAMQKALGAARVKDLKFRASAW